MKKILGLLLSMVLALSCMSVDVKAFSTGSNLIKLQFKEVGGINDNKPLPFTEGGVFNDGGSKWYPKAGTYQTKTIMVGQSFTITLDDDTVKKVTSDSFKPMPICEELVGEFKATDFALLENILVKPKWSKYVDVYIPNQKIVKGTCRAGQSITFTAKKAGTISVSLKLALDSYSEAELKIIIVDPKVVEPSLEFKSTTVNSGDVKSVKVKNMHKLLDSTLKLDVADKSVCSASIKGDTIEIKGKKAGSTTVTLTNSYKKTKKSKSIKVTVKETKKVKPSLSKAKVSVKAGKSATVKIKNYSKLSNVSVKTSKKSVATAKVNKKGTVTIKAKGKGTATITVKSAGGSKKIKVTVK